MVDGILKSLDIYGHPISLNYDGQSIYKTRLGTLVSVMTFALIIFNSVNLIEEFLSKQGQKESFQELKYQDDGEAVNLYDYDLDIMFTTLKDVPDLSQARLALYRIDSDVGSFETNLTRIELNECPREMVFGFLSDLQLDFSDKIETIIAGTQYLCIDDSEEAYIKGSRNLASQSSLILVIEPCEYYLKKENCEPMRDDLISAFQPGLFVRDYYVDLKN